MIFCDIDNISMFNDCKSKRQIVLCTNAYLQRAEYIYIYSIYIYSMWYIEVCCRLATWVLTYCFLKHVMGQILIALTLWVIFRMPSSQIYKYREIMPDIWHMIKWSHDQQQKKRNLVSFSCPRLLNRLFTLAVAASGQITWWYVILI